jgi:5-methylcytosine-specific restriction protein A
MPLSSWSVTGFTPKTRKTIFDRAQGRCERCTLRPIEQYHHRRARGAGGSKRPDTNTSANGLGLCSPCHLHIERNRTEALDHGWLVRQGHDPTRVPVYYQGSQWVCLTIEGSYVPTDNHDPDATLLE